MQTRDGESLDRRAGGDLVRGRPRLSLGGFPALEIRCTVVYVYRVMGQNLPWRLLG